MDASFGFEQLLDLRTPDLFEVELDAGRPIRFVRLDRATAPRSDN
jgi:hypothetical protein